MKILFFTIDPPLLLESIARAYGAGRNIYSGDIATQNGRQLYPHVRIVLLDCSGLQRKGRELNI